MFTPSFIVLVAATAIAAWPISFYPTVDCNSEPIQVLHESPEPGSCNLFHGFPLVKSYSGGTEDTIQKLLIYYDKELCLHDAAHRTHSNHTINNSVNKCIPFKKSEEIPRAFSFIEELIPVGSPETNGSSYCMNRLIIQT